jgi:hypothetical protein
MSGESSNFDDECQSMPSYSQQVAAEYSYRTYHYRSEQSSNDSAALPKEDTILFNKSVASHTFQVVQYANDSSIFLQIDLSEKHNNNISKICKNLGYSAQVPIQDFDNIIEQIVKLTASKSNPVTKARYYSIFYLSTTKSNNFLLQFH